MLAVIKTGGKQYKVEKGDKLKIEKIEGEAGTVVVFDQVLFLGDKTTASVGNPIIEGAKVEAKIVRQGKAAKVVGIKHKAKKRYKVKFGHRQPFTEVEITKVK